VARWHAHFGFTPVSVSALFPLVTEGFGHPLDVGLGSGDDRSQRTKLGLKSCAPLRDRRYGSLTIRNVGEYQGAQLWALHDESRVALKTSESAPDGTPSWPIAATAVPIASLTVAVTEHITATDCPLAATPTRLTAEIEASRKATPCLSRVAMPAAITPGMKWRLKDLRYKATR
jgi:hypothetical protein